MLHCFRKSIVWEFFNENFEDGKVISVQCKICDASYKYFGNTTNLRDHLKRKHPVELAIIEPETQQELPENADSGELLGTNMCDQSSSAPIIISDLIIPKSEPVSDDEFVNDSEIVAEKRSGKRRFKKSIVWEFLDKIYENGKVVAVRCHICDVILKFYGNTTNLKDHLKRKHPAELAEFEPQQEPVENTDSNELLDSTLCEQGTSGSINLNSQTLVSKSVSSARSFTKSVVWEFFSKNYENDKVTSVQCNQCYQNVKYYANTTNLWDHLKKKHPELAEFEVEQKPVEYIDCSELLETAFEQSEHISDNEVTAAENLPSARRFKKSIVWEFFNENYENDKLITVQCKFCYLNFKFCGNTTNLKHHLQRKHPALLAEIEAQRNLVENSDELLDTTTREENTSDSISTSDIIIEKAEPVSDDNEIAAENLPRVRRGKKSIVWEFFKKNYKNNKVITAQCNYCNAILKHYGNTTNYMDHLKKKHPNELAEFEAQRNPVENTDIDELLDTTSCEQRTSSPINISDIKTESISDDDEIVAENFPPARKKSIVWEFFKKNYENEKVTSVQCKHCYLNFRYSGNTTNLKVHLKRRHPDELAEFQAQQEPAENTDSSELLDTTLCEEQSDSTPIRVSDIIIEKTETINEDDEIVEENLPPARRYKKSIVWNFFNKNYEDGQVISVQCKICNANLRHFDNTTNLKDHLRRKHPIELAEVEEQQKSVDNAGSGEFLDTTMYKQRTSALVISNDQTVVAENPSSERSGKKSIVWNFFDKMIEDGEIKSVQCKDCDTNYKYYGNTTNLRFHLKRKHPIQLIKAEMELKSIEDTDACEFMDSSMIIPSTSISIINNNEITEAENLAIEGGKIKQEPLHGETQKFESASDNDEDEYHEFEIGQKFTENSDSEELSNATLCKQNISDSKINKKKRIPAENCLSAPAAKKLKQMLLYGVTQKSESTSDEDECYKLETKHKFDKTDSEELFDTTLCEQSTSASIPKNNLTISAENISPARCFKKSLAWEFYNKGFNKDGKIISIQCKICKSVFKYFGNTYNIREHLKRKHPVQFAEVEMLQKSIENTDSDGLLEATLFKQSASAENFSPPPAKKLKQMTFYNAAQRSESPSDDKKRHEFEKDLVFMIAVDCEPLSIVENPGFKYFVEKYVRRKLPSRKVLTESVLPEVYQSLSSDLKNMLDSVAHLSITVDMWSSDSSRSFLTIIAHFISDFTMHSKVLSTEEIKSDHSAESISGTINDILGKWQINEKVVTVVTDCTDNIKKAATDILRKPNHPCIAHILDSSVQSVIKENVGLDNLLTKCRCLVSYFKENSLAAGKLREEQEQMGPQDLKLKCDVPGRWNSAVIMMERLLKMKHALTSALSSLTDAPQNLDESEWATIDDCVKVLKLFLFMTEDLSKEKYPIISRITPLRRGLQLQVQTKNVTTDVGKVLKSSLLEIISERLGFLETTKTVAMTTFLDPRFKRAAFGSPENADNAQKWVTEELSEIIQSAESCDNSEIVQNVQSCDNSEIIQDCDNNDKAQSQSSPHSSDNNDLWMDFDSKVSATSSPVTPTYKATMTVKRYLELPHLDRKKDPLEFWKLQFNTFQHLYTLASKYLSIPATSLPAERLFHKDAIITHDKRKRLGPENLDELLFISENVNLNI